MPTEIIIPERRVTIYTAKELQDAFPKVFEKKHQKYCEYNWNDIWTEFVTDAMLAKLHELGWTKSQLYASDINAKGSDLELRWSLSCCQGDGACFFGNIDMACWKAVIAKNWTAEQAAEFSDIVDNHDVSIRLTHSGRYCHKYTVGINIDARWVEDTKRPTAFSDPDKFGARLDALEGELLELVKDACDEIETVGSDEIDSLQSEENFISDCNERGLFFEANGHEHCEET